METKKDLLAEFKSRPIWAGYLPGVKIPMLNKNKMAESDNNLTWQTYEEVTKKFGDKVGIFADGSTLLIDFDHITKDGTATDGIIDDPVAKQFLTECNTYAEWSPSKTGAHAIYFVTEPIELETHTYHVDKSIGRKYEYWGDDNRFFTITQDKINDLQIRRIDSDEALELLTKLGYGKEKNKLEAFEPVRKSTGDKPWDWYNNNVDIAEIIEPLGWKKLSTDNTGKETWKRPGKKENKGSATFNFDGNNLFRVFSSSVPGFDNEKSYTKAGVYAVLNCGGDFNKAVREICSEYPEARFVNRQAVPTSQTNNSVEIILPTADEVEDIFKLQSYNDIQNWNVEMDWLVEGLIPKGALVILAAASGVGKSWLALHLSKCFSQGGNFLENENNECDIAKTLYVDAENPRAVIKNRTDLLNYQESNNFRLLEAHRINLRETPHFQRLEKLVLEEEFKVVIIDTLRATAGGLDENNANEVRPFLSRFNKLRNAGVTVIFLDHTRKPERIEGYKPNKNQIMGSQDKVSAVDIVLMLGKNPATKFIEIYQEKNRFDEPHRIIAYKLDKTSDERIILVEQQYEEKPKKKTKEMIARELIPAILANSIKSRKEIIQLAKKKVGERKIDEVLAQLSGEGTIVKTGDSPGDFYKMVEQNS
jgi:RecA-family ATPase